MRWKSTPSLSGVQIASLSATTSPKRTAPSSSRTGALNPVSNPSSTRSTDPRTLRYALKS